MLRVKFEKQLQGLDNLITQMGYLCIVSIDKMTQALVNGDKRIANELMNADDEIDQLESEIQTLCLKILLQQQPVARDLRKISAAMKIITDMERIGDQTCDIAELIFESSHQNDVNILVDMAFEAKRMLQDSVNAYVENNVELAQNVQRSDDSVDEMFAEVRQNFVQRVQEKQEHDGVAMLDTLMIAKYLERIADHATNIAEWVEYAVLG